MKTNKFNITSVFIKLCLLVTGIMLVVASCDEDDYSVEGPLSMFTPGTITVESLETQAKLTWDPSLFTNGIQEMYTAQVSLDSLFADASAILLEKTTDTTGVVFTDAELAVRQKYYVRIKANSYEDRPESYWSESTPFKITGIQLLYPLYSPEVLATQVTAKWQVSEGVTHFTLQKYEQSETDPEPTFIGDPFDVSINASEASAGVKVITGLDPDSRYQIDLYKSALSVGYRSFKTKVEDIYTMTITPADDIVTIVNNSVDGDVIALEPGTYNANGDSFEIYSKAITLVSTSSNPNDTKIIFKEFTLKDTGAGLTVKGIELDGDNYSALYLVNLTSSNGNGDDADFEDVTFENCIVHGVNTSAFRANRGPTGGYSMSHFNFLYSEFYDFKVSSYAFLHIEELIFDEVNLSNSTFHNAGDLFIRFRKELSNPNPNATVNINNCTINSIGNSDNYTLLDCNNVPLNLNFTNSILANIPRDGGSAREDLIRVTNETSTINFSFNNFFNLTTGDPSEVVEVTIPEAAYITSQNISNIDLGWDNFTTDFTLDPDSGLYTGSSTGGPLGDPRWWY